MISHRLSNLKIADKILVLNHGMVVDRGNWEELIFRNEKYAEMLKTEGH